MTAQLAQERFSISLPVTSWTCRTRRFECPPSRPRSNSRCPETSRSSKCNPDSTNSRIRAGPSVMIVRNDCLVAKARARCQCVAHMQLEESSPLVTQAMPPCAHAVLLPRLCVSCHDCDRPVTGRFQSETQSGNTAADDDKIVFSHGSWILSISRVFPKKTARARTASDVIRSTGCKVSHQPARCSQRARAGPARRWHERFARSPSPISRLPPPNQPRGQVPAAKWAPVSVPAR